MAVSKLRAVWRKIDWCVAAAFEMLLVSLLGVGGFAFLAWAFAPDGPIGLFFCLVGGIWLGMALTVLAVILRRWFTPLSTPDAGGR